MLSTLHTQDVGLLASGSADGSINFWVWSHESVDFPESDDDNYNRRVKSLSEFSHWVVKIILRSSFEHTIKPLGNKTFCFQ